MTRKGTRAIRSPSVASRGRHGVGKRAGATGLACRSKVGLSPAGRDWAVASGGRAKPGGMGVTELGWAGRRRATSGRWRCVCCRTRFAERRRCPGCEFRFPVPAVRRRRWPEWSPEPAWALWPEASVPPVLDLFQGRCGCCLPVGGLCRAMGTNVAGFAGLSLTR